jgi:type IV pilus assembly protein PilN
MIRINLLGEKFDNSAAYALQGVLYLGSVFLTIFLLFLIQDSVEFERLSRIDEKEALSRRLVKLEQVTKQVKDLEEKQKTLKEKLTTIATLKRKKHGPVHVLDDLATALPEKAWVVDLTQKDNVISLKGIALDNQTVADFVSKVRQYPLFDPDRVEIVKSSEFLRDNVKLKEFLLTVQLKPALGTPDIGEKSEKSRSKG